MDILPAHHYQFSGFLTAVASLSLVILVYKRGVDLYLKKRFTFYYASLFIWSLSLFICTSLYNYQASYFFCQLTHAGAICIPVFFLHFTFAYLNRVSKYEKILLVILYCLAGFFLIINLFFRHLFFDNIVPKLSFPYFPNDGLFYTPWVLTFALAVVLALYALWRAMRSASGLRRKQLRFFLVANALGYTGGIGCFLPVYDLPYFPFPFGPYGVFLLSLVSGYAILRYKFLDLSLFLKNTIIFASLFGIIIGVFSFTVFVFQNILNKYININPFLVSALSVLSIMLIYDKARSILVNLTDTFLFQRKYNYQKLLKDASKGMSSIEDFNHLVSLVLHFMTRRARIKNAALYVKNKTDDSFGLVANRGYKQYEIPKNLDASSQIIKYLDKEKEVVEIERLVEKSDRYEVSKIQEQMKELKANCCVPSFLSGDIRNILILGEKKSDESYTDEDLNVFFTLAQESAIAIENARLYDEAIQRSLALEEANKKIRSQRDELVEKEKKATMVGMAGAMGHEISNPMTSILMGLDLLSRLFLKKTSKVFEDSFEYIAELSGNKNGERLESLRSDKEGLESSFKKQDSHIRFNCKRIETYVKNMKGLMDDVGSGMSAIRVVELCEHGVSVCQKKLIDCDIKMNLNSDIKFFGNLESLVDVMKNLIMNAYEAMGEQKNKQIQISCGVDDFEKDMIYIEVRDNGPGIPEEVLDNIWTQGFSTKERKDESLGASGQGQGLYMCKKMVEMFHGGDINVTSKLGEGTAFRIKFNQLHE